MSPVIRIPEELYSRLAQHAKGFDTPVNVIETLLNHFEGVKPKVSNTTTAQIVTKKRDTTKYLYKNQQYGKSKLVLAIVKDYVASNPKITFDKLLKSFPKDLQGSTGVFNELSYVQKKYEKYSDKRHYIKDNEIVNLQDCDIVICTQWGAGYGDNIGGFVKHAKSLGYDIAAKNG